MICCDGIGGVVASCGGGRVLNAPLDPFSLSAQYRLVARQAAALVLRIVHSRGGFSVRYSTLSLRIVLLDPCCTALNLAGLEHI